MSADKWKLKTLPSLRTSSSASSQHDTTNESSDPADYKKPRVLTKALRTLSSSSLDSINNASPKRSMSSRRLQKAHSGSGSMLDRLHKRVSKDFATASSSPEAPSSHQEIPYSSMKIIHRGHLKPDASLLKARTEYLVLTDQCLVKFSNIEAAQAAFPQLNQAEEGFSPLTPSPSGAHRVGASEVRLEIPLRSIVSVFNDEGASPRFGLELWAFSPWPRLAYSRAHIYFCAPDERDVWLSEIQRAYRTRIRGVSTQSVLPENLRTRINRIVENTETMTTDGGTQNLTFPVARRHVGNLQKAGSAEDSDSPSFFFVIGPCMCYFIEVLRAEHHTFAGDLRVKATSFGTVTLTQFRASVATHEQRFVVRFRSPFAAEVRLDLASAHYRRIIEALTKVDRIIKPMWPQNLQQILFEVKGLPPPLTLSSGDDHGGLVRSLRAYCCAFSVPLPLWTIGWGTGSTATFRLLPSGSSPYTALQILAVFRALRYNTYFKAVSFRDVDLSALSHKHEQSDIIIVVSKTGREISEEHQIELSRLPLLGQEMHNLVFASESVRDFDFTNVLGTQDHLGRNASLQNQVTRALQVSSEVFRPILMLLRHQGSIFNSICISHNPLSPAEVDDLANALVLDHVAIRRLEVSRCGLGTAGLSKLWSGLAGQATRLEYLDTSDNQGKVHPDIICLTLSKLRALKTLKLAGNTSAHLDKPLLDQAAICRWKLEDLDLSNIDLNDATVDVLTEYLQTAASEQLQCIRLNKCKLTGRQIARLFRSMGQARRITIHINANQLDDGIEDLCGAIACGFGPWSLFMQMVEFCYESSYTKLWRALTVNKTIECLSLAGSATPDDASNTACRAVSEFFEKNETVRYLDISGYDAKLDEGRLGKEFSKSLSGLRKNKRIEHLRVRSQMLNINIGDLAQALAGNRTLQTVDCESNDFNLSNYWHLIKHVDLNPSIRHFSAFSELELERAKRKSMEDAGGTYSVPKRRNSVMTRLRSERPQTASNGALVDQLKMEWENAASCLSNILERNSGAPAETPPGEELSNLQSDRNSYPVGAFTAEFGGLAIRDAVSRQAQNARASVSPGQSPAMDMSTLAGRESRSQSLASSEAAPSPATDRGSFASGRASPPVQAATDGQDRNSDGAQSPVLMGLESHYTYHEEGHDQDLGMVMRSYNRFLGDAENRIDEEEIGSGG